MAKPAPNQMELIVGATEVVAKPKKVRAAKVVDSDHLPPNLAKPVPVKVPDFSDPKRPKTCLEVDFPIVPINALSSLEGNAGKPIYQMSKWWARRRSCVFRAMLIAAAMESPTRKGPDGEPILDEDGVPIPDETEAAKAVWDVYYANHQQAENFKHLRVLDCFMGGGTTLVEGSRLGFQVAGVDLNPVAWFIVKNELDCTDPEEVKRFFDQIEVEVKPQIQPFYVTDCPRGHKGKWFEIGSGNQVDADPATLPADERKKYRYEGPEVIYTFWAKHGPCLRPECSHRTPIFRSPVIAEKKLGVKYMELTCKQCKTSFHAELGSARMAPGAEQVILDNEHPFTEFSQPFARRLLDYGKGTFADKVIRAFALSDLIEKEPGLKCPRCGDFAGQWLRDILAKHKYAKRLSDIDKKHLKILPPRNSIKPVYCYLLIHSEWLKGSPGIIGGAELGGYADGTPDANAAWYRERLKNLRLIEVRGRIRLSADTSIAEHPPELMPEGPADPEAADESEPETADRKAYGLPRYITLSDGSRIDSRCNTVPKPSHFTCGACGQMQDVRYSVQAAKRLAPVASYALQCSCPECESGAYAYGGRFFKAASASGVERIIAAERDWDRRRDADLKNCWPRAEIPFSYMTHQANFALPEQGYTHWWKMFGPRQLLVHSALLKAMLEIEAAAGIKHQAFGGLQQFLRNQNMFCIWNIQADKLEPFFANSNYAPKTHPVENSVFANLGRGNWTSTVEKIEDGLQWAREPWEVALPEYATASGESRLALADTVLPGAAVRCGSSTDLS